ncbi:isochorismate synthase MenF [Microbacterium sp. P03]|uniref:isochorismate synthase n=1 Tax=Microbacterium sp. P03 TaxID=3366946 RepID=UPI003745E42C
MRDSEGREVPRLCAETREIDHVDDLLDFADPTGTLAWLRRGDGIVALSGVGEPVFTLSEDGATDLARIPRLAARWRAISDVAEVDDDVRVPGTGLVGFSAIAFDDRSSAPSTIIVPSALVGRRAGRSWVTRIRRADAAYPELPTGLAPWGAYWSATLGPGSLDPAAYQSAVHSALDAIAAGEVSKVVLARDLRGTVPAGADLRRLARALSTGYPDCWAFAVDGLIGASPETLVTVSRGTVTARVLAGTTPRGADADADTLASAALATSAKDQDEHLYAVRSVLGSLRSHTSALAASEQPFTLKLPNVWHLATDVEGTLSGAASALDLVGALHPTAAVAGTPTAAALAVIDRLEPFDRGRYAGPVGWVDGTGDGEWAIALRCAQIGAPDAATDASPDGAPDVGSPTPFSLRATLPVVAHAGAGIVAGSDPESELMETRVKFRPIVDALA